MTATHVTDCRFCSYFSGRGNDPIDTPWLKNERYCAIVSKGALVPGWSLVCPSEHILSLANEYGRSDFWRFAAKAATVVQSRYGDVRVFEHGAVYSGSPTGCGTDHAHLHLVPLPFALSPEALEFDRGLSWSKCRACEIGDLAAGREYLFVSDKLEAAETAGFLSILPAPTSQFFRRVVASKLGLSDFFDYRRHPMLDIARVSARDLRASALRKASSTVG